MEVVACALAAVVIGWRWAVAWERVAAAGRPATTAAGGMSPAAAPAPAPAPAVEGTPPTAPATESPMPMDLILHCEAESEPWARQDRLRHLEDLYVQLRSWDKVRAAVSLVRERSA